MEFGWPADLEIRDTADSVEQLTGQTFLQVRADSQAIARYGVPTRNVLNIVEAVGSRRVGDVRDWCQWRWR